MFDEDIKGFDVNVFISTQPVEDLVDEKSIHFYDGVDIQYGRFYPYNYKRRSGRKKIDKDSKQDPSIRTGH